MFNPRVIIIKNKIIQTMSHLRRKQWWKNLNILFENCFARVRVMATTGVFTVMFGHWKS